LGDLSLYYAASYKCITPGAEQNGDTPLTVWLIDQLKFITTLWSVDQIAQLITIK